MSQTIRSALWLMFFSGIIAAWIVLYQMNAGMGLDFLGRPAMDMADMGAGTSELDMDPAPMDMAAGDAMTGDAAMTADTTATGTDVAMTDAAAIDEAMDMGGMDMAEMTRFPTLFGMWSLMMAAMMLPTLVPTLTTYDRLIVSANGTRAGWIGVLAGYSVVWVGMAAVFAGAQVLLLNIGIIDRLGAATSIWIAGGMLVAVGAFQFSRAKEVCHGVCHAPMTYFLGHWRTGFAGGLRMGATLGTYCAGCCWGFMALGFAGGMMSLLWMGLATLFMVLEKLPQIGHHVMRPLGVALILGGVAVLAAPLVTA